MKIKRLERLRDVVVPKIDRTDFHMGLWKCGTVRCLGGWACSDGQFGRGGLRFSTEEEEKVPAPMLFNQDGWHYGYRALELFFGLSERQAERIFEIDAYPTRIPTIRQMQRRINEIIAEGKAA